MQWQLFLAEVRETDVKLVKNYNHKANTSFYHQDLAYYIKPLTHYIWDRPKLQVLQLLYLHVEFDKIIFEQAPFSK